MSFNLRPALLTGTFLGLVLSVEAQPQPAPKRAQQPQPKPPTAEEMKKRVPPDVSYLPDLAYREGNPAWRLDLAMPAERGSSPRPGIVIVHGGGWRGGDKRPGMWGQLPLEYAQKGYVAISINYRLATEAPFPACVEDVKCAVRWLRAHAKEYNLDPERVGGYGHSAGAHLTAMLALVGPEAGLEGDGPYREQSSLLQAACISAPPLDLLNWRAQTRLPPWNFGGLLAGPDETFQDRAKKASPITYAHAGAPPMLIVQGTDDIAVPISQPEGFVKALRGAGAKDVTYLIFDGANHGLPNTHATYFRAMMAAFFDAKLGSGRQGANSDR